MKKVCYSQPPIDQTYLVAKLFGYLELRKQYKDNGAPTRHTLQVTDLVRSYANWWIARAYFPEKKIICPDTVWFVRKVHAMPESRLLEASETKTTEAIDSAEFARAWVSYCGNHYPDPKKDIFGPTTQNDQILTAAHAINELFDDPGIAWEPLLREAKNISRGQVVYLGR